VDLDWFLLPHERIRAVAEVKFKTRLKTPMLNKKNMDYVRTFEKSELD